MNYTPSNTHHPEGESNIYGQHQIFLKSDSDSLPAFRRLPLINKTGQSNANLFASLYSGCMMGACRRKIFEDPLNFFSDKSTRTIIIAGFLMVCQSGLCAESCPFELVDGEITEHRYKGLHGNVRISVPRVPPSRHGYPVIFYYHGASTGLKPNLRILHAVTGGLKAWLDDVVVRNSQTD